MKNFKFLQKNQIIYYFISMWFCRSKIILWKKTYLKLLLLKFVLLDHSLNDISMQSSE